MNSKILGLVAVGLLAGPIQVAHSTILAQASGSIYSVDVQFYKINADGPAFSFSFFDTDNELRALVSADVGPACIFNGCEQTQAVQYTKLPTLPVASISASNGAGSAFGAVTTYNNGDDSRVDGNCNVTAGNSGCTGGAVFSTSSRDALNNLILGANTGVRMTALSDVSASILNFCNITCNRAFVRAELLADFTFSSAGFARARSDLGFNAQFLGSFPVGALISDFRNNSPLLVDYQNTTGGDVRGRIRWIVTASAASAVPEPGTLALLGLGLAGLGLSRRRKA